MHAGLEKQNIDNLISSGCKMKILICVLSLAQILKALKLRVYANFIGLKF